MLIQDDINRVEWEKYEHLGAVIVKNLFGGKIQG